jgi:hypothetical protein
MRYTIRLTICSFVLVAVAGFSAAGTEFEVLADFPKAAAGAYGVKAEGLPDGRFIVWNGDAVFVQTIVGGNAFKQIASGYAGDPGFIAVSPDGHTVLLGAGYSGKLYKLDVWAPVSYSPGSEAATVTHYYGVYLTQDLVLLDRAADDLPTTELVVVDVSSPSPVPVRVMFKPDETDLTGDQYGVSACLAINSSRTTVYTMGLVYDGWTLVSNQLKKIPASVLIGAYQAKTDLDWNTDAIAIGGPGAFNSGGPGGISSSEELFIGGFGGVQRVNPFMATVVATYDPAGPFEYYGVASNPYTDVVLPIVADPADYSMDVVYAPEGAFAAVPALGAVGLVMVVAMVILSGVWRLTRHTRDVCPSGRMR